MHNLSPSKSQWDQFADEKEDELVRLVAEASAIAIFRVAWG